MKLCQKCEVTIRSVARVESVFPSPDHNILDELRKLKHLTEIREFESILRTLKLDIQTVPDSDCEFWAHKLLRDSIRWWTIIDAANHAREGTDFPNGEAEHEKWLMARLLDGTWNT